MKLEKKIGLAGGTAIVVGGVIGMGAYALVPAIVDKAGNAYWLAVLIALAVSLISVLPLIQISSALPIAGGGYMYASRLISPLAGTLTSFWALIGGACSISLISVGLADYFNAYMPFHFSPHVMAMMMVASFFVFYLFGIKLLSSIQIILSVQLVLALLLYAFPVLVVNHNEIKIGMPASGSFLLAVILSMNIALGFQIIIELGEEIKEPQKNIPLALLIGSVIILIIYLLVMFAYESTHPQSPINLLDSAKPYLSQAAVRFIELGMISAGLTSYNGAAIALPREFYSMSRDRTLPFFLSRLNSKGNPTYSVTAFFMLVIIILSIGQLLDSLGIIHHFFGKEVIEFYGFMTIMGIMMLTIVLSFAAFILPKKFPQQYAGAYIKFPRVVLYTFILISVIASSGMILIICSKWIVPLLYLAFTLLILFYFIWRKKKLKTEGVEIGQFYNAMEES